MTSSIRFGLLALVVGIGLGVSCGNERDLWAQENAVQRDQARSGDQQATQAAPDAPNVENATAVDAKQEYYTLGAMQLYESDRRLWLFLNIDHARDRPAYASPPVSKTTVGFRAYELDASGVRNVWESADEAITAHNRFAVFYRKDGITQAYMKDSGKFFRFEPAASNKEATVVPAGQQSFLDYILLNERSIAARLQKESEDGFSPVDNGFGGYGKLPEVFVADEIGVRIRFLPHSGAGRRGLSGAVAEGKTDGVRWEATLIDFESVEESEP